MSIKKKTGLGKGLGALLSEPASIVLEMNGIDYLPERVVNIGEIMISQIEVNPFQPRSHFNQDALNELAQSIQIQGIIQPITVRKLSDNTYQLI